MDARQVEIELSPIGRIGRAAPRDRVNQQVAGKRFAAEAGGNRAQSLQHQAGGGVVSAGIGIAQHTA